jgi:hypothetical protein
VRIRWTPRDELLDVSAGGESAGSAADEQRSDVIALLDFGQHRGELAPRCEIERIEWRAVEDDRADSRGDVDLESDRRLSLRWTGVRG